MTPSLRDMPTLVAHREGRRWAVALPGGRTVSSGSKARLEAIVAREVPFTSLRFPEQDRTARHNGPYLRPLRDRMAAKIDDSGGPAACWPWTGAINSKGYGHIGLGGRDAPMEVVHRIVLTEKLGRPIAAGMYACHTCDHKWCANPAHLYEGTPTQNARDYQARGADTTPKPARRSTGAGALAEDRRADSGAGTGHLVSGAG